MSANSVSQPQGIGGWLILPILGLVITVGYSFYGLFQILIQWENFKLLFSAEGSAAEIKYLVILSELGSLAILVTALIAILRIYKLSSRVIDAMTLHYSVLLLVALLEIYFDRRLSQLIPNTQPDPSVTVQAVRVFGSVAIWLPYFYRSKRVKNTFTRP